MSSSSTQPTSWGSKELTLEQVEDKIPNGSSIFISSTACTAQATLEALVDSYKLADIQIIQMIPGGDLPHLKANPDRFRTRTFYSFSRSTFHQEGTRESLADYTPMSISAVPRLLEEKIMPVDIVILKVTPPHKGYCSLGMGVECTLDFLQHARVVIAEVNEHMPWTEGPSKIPIDKIDWWIARKNEPLPSTADLWPNFVSGQAYPSDVLDAIGKNALKLIPDGATLNIGLNPTAFSVFPFLHQRKNLGLHTDVFTENLFQLQMQGVINNSMKTIDRGRTVVSQAHGSQDLYDFLDRNPAIEFHPMSYVNDPQVIGRLDNFVSVIGALKIDLTGQVATDSIAHKFYGGVWNVDDVVSGAHFSKGGKSIVALPSKSLSGRSNLVFALPAGTGVSITRSSVEYVVTEYGTACLYGKSIRERCLALIDIAHPDFRRELLDQAKANHYISTTQPGLSFQNKYPAEFECFYTTKKSNKKVFARPIKAVDEDELRNFFHKLSDHSVYLRYFRKMRSMPQRILQKTADVDYATDMAVVVLYPPDNTVHSEMVGLAQWVTGKDGIPEIAFQVRDDWQGEGLGTFLFLKLVEMARVFGLSQFKADVLADNKAMSGVFDRSGIPKIRRSDFGVYTYYFDLSPVKSNENDKGTV